MEEIIKDIMSSVSSDELLEALNFTPPAEPLLPIDKVLRTPEERFHNLQDYDFQPNYIESKVHGDIRIHFVDEGKRDAKETVLLMHG